MVYRIDEPLEALEKYQIFQSSWIKNNVNNLFICKFKFQK